MFVGRLNGYVYEKELFTHRKWASSTDYLSSLSLFALRSGWVPKTEQQGE